MTNNLNSLSKRELEIFNAMVAGEIPSTTADRLGLNVSTITEYRRRVKEKLNAETIQDVITIANKMNHDRMTELENALRLFIQPDFRGWQHRMGHYMGWSDNAKLNCTERIEIAKKALEA